MSNVAVKVENLSKAYQLGQIGTGTISRDMERWVAKIRGKEDPFLRIGETNDRSTKGGSDIVWSLKDINFEIEQGDAVGIIGRNGAGKSTLLKILSKVTAPTTGKISGKGRIASLLEVGTGFHPELSGRENIFLNGAILGMRKKEIQRKFDEIVDFAGIERYIDTPVKRYSSGMYVRLAFAVAAHLESEILIVDEVLAVGDAEFQKKCLGKMSDVSKGEGRTVLFVSHNMGSILQLCKSAMFMQNGTLLQIGNVKQVVEKYLTSNIQPDEFKSENVNSYFRHIYLSDRKMSQRLIYLFDEDIFINFQINLIEELQDLTLSIVLKDLHDIPISNTHFKITYKNKGNWLKIKATLPANFVLPGSYKIEPILHIPNIKFVEKIPTDLNLSIEDSGSENTPYINSNLGPVSLPFRWQIENFSND